METRKCRTCSDIKEITEYHYHNGKYRLDCKICFRLEEKRRRFERVERVDTNHADRILEYRKEINDRGPKPEKHAWCYECKNYKSNDNFSPCNLKNNGKCRTCSSEHDIQRARELKQKAISYLGGKCTRCGFIGHFGSYDFHHSDPNDKEFNWNVARKKSWNNLLPELNKCVLLCRNCHTFIHCKLNEDGSLNPEYIPSNV